MRKRVALARTLIYNPETLNLTLARVPDPLITAIYSIPKLALAPLFIFVVRGWS